MFVSILDFYSDKRWRMLTAFLLTVTAALYFRTYPLRSGSLVSDDGIGRRAGAVMQSNMLKQLETHLATQAPQLSLEVRQKLARQKLDELIHSDDGAYQKAVSGAAQDMGAKARALFTYRYLSEADPYYYYALTQNILRNGRLGAPAAGGCFWNPRRLAPFGNADAMNWHPYIGLWASRLVAMVNPSMSMMLAVGFTPLFLTVFAVAGYFLFAWLLSPGIFAFELGALVLFLSPIVIQRSTLGWYDTDPYNLIFPMLIFATLLAALKKPDEYLLLACVGGFLTGLYPLFWQGWLFILMLMAGVAGVIGLRDFFTSGRRQTAILSFAILYTLVSLLFATLFLTPAGFYEAVLNGVLYSARVRGASQDLWPNLLVLVGETADVTLKKWVYLTSHYGVVALAALGLGVPAIKIFQRRASGDTRPWAAVALMAGPLILFTFTAERFAILAVFPLSLLAAFGAQECLNFTADLAKRFQLPSLPLKVAGYLLITALIIPRTLMGAHVSGYQSHFIMNDEWYGVLTDIKEKTPPQTIVHSWWPPGYFINAIAERRSVVDGGSHQRHENFWMAKVLMSRDSKGALGILRMISVGGSKPMDELAKKDIRGDVAVRLLLTITRETRARAAELLPAAWSSAEKEALLDLTHGSGTPPPSVVLLYDDLIEKNLMLQVIDQWSFERARTIFDAAQNESGPLGGLLPKGAADYTRKMLQVTGQGLPYEAPSVVTMRRAGKILFKNGLVFDAVSGSGFLAGSKFPKPEPVDVFYKKAGVWTESSPESKVSVAAILLEEGDSQMSVLCHRRLVSTLVYQLTYLEGAQFPAFVKISHRGQFSSGRYVSAYGVDWSALDR